MPAIPERRVEKSTTHSFFDYYGAKQVFYFLAGF